MVVRSLLATVLAVVALLPSYSLDWPLDHASERQCFRPNTRGRHCAVESIYIGRKAVSKFEHAAHAMPCTQTKTYPLIHSL